MSTTLTKQKPQRALRDGRPRLTTEVARLFPLQGEWTEEHYFALPETNHFIELSEGRLVMPDLPNDPHQYAVLEFAVRIRAFVLQHRLGDVRVSPIPIRLWPGKIREPDVVFMKASHARRKTSEYWGVPDLVVEVLSPRTRHTSGTEKVDRGEKFREYAQAGIPEYWIAHPETRIIEVYVLRKGQYQLLGKWGEGERAHSKILAGFELAVDEVFLPA